MCSNIKVFLNSYMNPLCYNRVLPVLPSGCRAQNSVWFGGTLNKKYLSKDRYFINWLHESLLPNNIAIHFFTLFKSTIVSMVIFWIWNWFHNIQNAIGKYNYLINKLHTFGDCSGTRNLVLWYRYAYALKFVERSLAYLFYFSITHYTLRP